MNLPNLNLEMCNAAESMEWGEGVTVVSTLESANTLALCQSKATLPITTNVMLFRREYLQNDHVFDLMRWHYAFEWLD